MKMKLTKRYKGGGGTTTVQSIPDWMQPSISKVTGQAESDYNMGNLSKVAAQSGLQDTAFGSAAGDITSTGQQGVDILQAQQQRLSSMADTPSADTLEAQKQAIVLDAQKRTAGLNTNFGQTGTLGSGREAVMQGAQNAETTGKLAQVNADYENKMFQNRLQAEGALGTSVGQAGGIASGTAKSLADLGGQERAVDQSQLDSSWQGLQRYASTVYGNPARQSAVAGGK